MTEHLQNNEPRRERPVVPGYGVPENTEGLLPWSHVEQRLTDAANYWVATASRAGRPHAVPVWAVWVDDQLIFSVGPRSVRNLAANPAVSIHLESGNDVVIIEGDAHPVHQPDPAFSNRVIDAYAAKYDYHAETIDGMWALRPTTAYAWTSFPADATRWRFA